MLKRVYEFVNFINTKDRNANVILISDHGQNVEDFFYSRFDTFTLVKTNEECQHNVSDVLNTINAARLMIGCTIGQTPDFIEKKSYFVNFESGNVNIGGKFRLEEVDPNSDYSDFSEKLTALFQQDQEEYIRDHKETMQYYMNFGDDPRSVSTQISQKIDTIVKNFK